MRLTISQHFRSIVSHIIVPERCSYCRPALVVERRKEN